jgi:replication factor RFC1-like protein
MTSTANHLNSIIEARKTFYELLSKCVPPATLLRELTLHILRLTSMDQERHMLVLKASSDYVIASTSHI